MIEDIAELKPTIFCAVPRVLDRIYSGKPPFGAEYITEFYYFLFDLVLDRIYSGKPPFGAEYITSFIFCYLIMC